MDELQGEGLVDQERRPAWWLPAMTFSVGLLLGWLVIGWWLWPLRTTNVGPAELAPAAQTEWVRMVADLYQRETGRDDRLERAEARLASLDDDGIAAGLGRVVGGEDAVDAQNARLLGADLEIVPIPPDPVVDGAASEQGAGSTASGGLAQAARTLAIAVLVAAAAAALSLAWAWFRWRSQDGARRAPPARGAAEANADGATTVVERAVERITANAEREATGGGLPPDDEPAAAEAAESPTSDSNEGRRGRRRGFTPLPRPDGATEALELPRRLGGGAGAPAWRPARIDLGDSARVEYDGADDRFFQTWLVYDERAGLVGSAGLKAQPVGSINTLDLWFFERDEEGEPHERPMVTLLARPALSEPVLRARLRDRELLPAEPGARTTLHAGELSLEVTVEAVEPDPGEEELALRHVSLRLTPHREDQPDAMAAGDEPDPPMPLPFRRDR